MHRGRKYRMANGVTAPVDNTPAAAPLADNTPTGALAATISSGLDTIFQTTINDLFNHGLQKQAQNYNEQLSSLSASQQQLLNEQLLAATTDTQRMQILDNAVAQIQQTSVTSAGTSNFETGLLICLGAGLLIFAAIVYKKYS